MTRYIVRRLVEAIPVVIGVSILAFMLIHLIPGDPALAMLGERASPENVQQLREQLGLDKPIYEQYLIWVGNLLQGDFGRTVQGNILIKDEIARRFPATVELSVAALFLAIIIGIPMGIVSAINRNTFIDTAVMFFALFGVSIPIFVLGLLLIFIVGVELNWLPFVGRSSFGTDITQLTGMRTVDALLTGNGEGFVDALKRLTLPAVTLSTIPMAIVARITRSSMLEVLNQDYIRTAQSKGLRRWTVVIRHALPNALLPIITIVGLQLGTLLSGAVLTETIFSWPGVGKWLFNSIQGRDYTIVQTMTLILALIYIFINLVVDVLYAAIDPRIRYS